MADIELVIKIPEEKYERLLYQDIISLRSYVENGIVLPKGHGRLIDADSMKTMKNIQSANFNAVELIRLWIDKQDTIIEPDKAESEDKERANDTVKFRNAKDL